jgi:MinD-like ATPase involved in chromosome partitioning or flagellar assembly
MNLTLIRDKPKPKSALATASLVIAIFGPTGSTGKSSLALNLAYEFAELGKKTILIDLDTHSPSQATLLGISEPTAAITGCARLIRQGRFDREQLERLSVRVNYRKTSFHCLTGLASPRRWGEISDDTVTHLLNLVRFEFEIVIIDLASSIEDQLTSPATSVSRNTAARAVLAKSDLGITVINPSQLSISRYLTVFAELQEMQRNRLIVLNRSESKPAVVAALKSLTKETIFATIPDDQVSFELAESEHLPLALARRKSPARNAIAQLTNKLLECPPLTS